MSKGILNKEKQDKDLPKGFVKTWSDPNVLVSIHVTERIEDYQTLVNNN